MKINIDCFKDVLQYCIDNIDYEEDGDSWNTKCVNLIMMYESPKLKYENKDIMRSVLKLIECGFIEVLSKHPNNKPYLERCSIEDVTFKGYQFADSIKDPSVWEKTKSIASKIGNHTLDFIEGTAHDIAIASAKQAVTVMMMKNNT